MEYSTLWLYRISRKGDSSKCFIGESHKFLQLQITVPKTNI